MGLILFFVASVIASEIFILSFRICHNVCSTIKMELLTTIPAKIINPNIVSISKGCGWNLFKITSANMPPAPAIGTVTIITIGSTNDFIKIASNRNITKRAIITLFFIATHVRSNSLAAPDKFIETPSGIFFSIGFTTRSCSFKTASSKDILSWGLNCRVITLLPDNLFICWGTPIILISATWDNLTNSPDFVINGKSLRLSILLTLALSEVKTRSISLPSKGISVTLTPSLNTSNDCANSLADIPMFASFSGIGLIITWGEPAPIWGTERTWCPSLGGNSFLTFLITFWAVGCIKSRDGPVISNLITLAPPTDLPNKEACCAKALAPGCDLIGFVRTGRISFTLLGSSVAAPAKAPPE